MKLDSKFISELKDKLVKMGRLDDSQYERVLKEFNFDIVRRTLFFTLQGNALFIKSDTEFEKVVINLLNYYKDRLSILDIQNFLIKITNVLNLNESPNLTEGYEISLFNKLNYVYNLTEALTEEGYNSALDQLNKLYNKLSTRPEEFTEKDQEVAERLEKEISRFTKNSVDWKDLNTLKTNFKKVHLDPKEKFGITFEEIKDLRDKKISKYIGLAEKYAKQIYEYLPPVFEKDELISVAEEKLVELISAYYGNPKLFLDHWSKSSKDLKVGPFILKGANSNNPLISPVDGRFTKAIKGAVLDYVRDQDNISSHYRTKVDEIKKIIRDFQDKNNRNPSIDELAKESGLDKQLVKKYMNLMNLKSTTFDDTIDTLRGGGNGWKFKDGQDHVDPDNPETIVIRADTLERCSNEISKLPYMDKIILELTQFDDLSIKETSIILKISESEVEESLEKSIKLLTPALKKIFGDSSSAEFVFEE